MIVEVKGQPDWPLRLGHLWLLMCFTPQSENCNLQATNLFQQSSLSCPVWKPVKSGTICKCLLTILRQRGSFYMTRNVCAWDQAIRAIRQGLCGTSVIMRVQIMTENWLEINSKQFLIWETAWITIARSICNLIWCGDGSQTVFACKLAHECMNALPSHCDMASVMVP